MRDFRRLDVWHKSIELGGVVYAASRNFPNDEKYAMRKQVRGASVSVLSNIAEGAGRRTVKDVSHFLHIARGSTSEVEAQAHFAEHLGWMRPEDRSRISELADEIRAMLIGLARSLR